MTVVVNDPASVAQAIRAQADAGAAKGSQADAFAQDLWRRNFEDTAALRDDCRGRGGIRLAIRAKLVCSTEDAVSFARDRIHERRIIADDGAGRRCLFRNDDDLAAMRLDIRDRAGAFLRRLRCN